MARKIHMISYLWWLAHFYWCFILEAARTLSVISTSKMARI